MNFFLKGGKKYGEKELVRLTKQYEIYWQRKLLLKKTCYVLN